MAQRPAWMDAPSPLDGCITWIKSNKWICWIAFWLVWLHFYPESLPVGLVAFMVAYVYYRERTVNLPTICATYLGVWLYIALGQMAPYFSNDALVWMGWAAVFSLVILGVRYPWCGIILLWLVTLAFNKGNYGGYYGRGYYRRRRW